MNDSIRNTFLEEKDKYKSLVDAGYFAEQAIKAALKTKKADFMEDAFSFAEQNKSILLSDALKGNKALRLGDLPDTLAAEEQALQKQLSALKKQEIEAKNAAQKDEALKKINDINLQIATFKQSIKNKYPKYHQLKYEQLTTQVADVKAILDDESLFLEYFIADSALYLFAITKNDFQLFELPLHRSQLQVQIDIFRKSLSDYSFIKNNAEQAYKDYCSSAFWLYSQLLQPALQQINKNQNIHNLIIVTDGNLGHLPFETFLQTQAPEKGNYADLNYLIKDFSVGYNYSAGLWKESLQNSNKTNNGELFAFAASYSKNKGNATATRSPRLRNLRNNLVELPAAISEVSDLSEMFKGDFVTGNQANEHYFKSKAHDYSIIHLAMHGVLQEKQTMLSCLAFTENHDSLEDNFLEAWEISKLQLNADLVVLSACETGYGKFQQGEGVLSLARAFMYAGVPAMVVSMWEVNDASTAQIMKYLYQNLANGNNKTEALRLAKLSYLSNTKGLSAHPAYWAPFIHIGNNKPIVIHKKSTGLWWWMGGGAVALLIVVGLLVSKRRKKG